MRNVQIDLVLIYNVIALGRSPEVARHGRLGSRFTPKPAMTEFGCASDSLDAPLLRYFAVAGGFLAAACINSSLEEPHLSRCTAFRQMPCRERPYV